MNDWWFKAQYKWAKQFKRLNDEQLGKFCRALFLYAQTGEITELGGAEGMLLDIVIDDIEEERQRADDISKKRSAASKGNKAEQTPTNDNKSEQTHTNGVQTPTNDNKTGNSKEIIDKNKELIDKNIEEEVVYAHAREEGAPSAAYRFEVDPDDPDVQAGLNAHRLIARHKLSDSPATVDTLIADIKQYGLEKVEGALGNATNADSRGGVSLNFYRAFLNDRPKAAAKPMGRIKKVTEAMYDQRVYDDDSDKLPDWMIEKIKEMDKMEAACTA